LSRTEPRAGFFTPRLGLLSLAHFTVDSYSSFFSPLLPLLVHKLNMNLTRVGALVALASVASSFAQPVFGFLSDRVHRPWFVAFGPLVAAVFLSMVGVAPSYPALVALLMTGGIGVAAFHPQAAVIAGELSPRRALAMSFFVTGGTLGFSLGPMLAVTTVSWLGLGRTWVAAFPGLLMCALLAAWFARVKPATHGARARARLTELRPYAWPLALLYVATVSRSAVSYGFMTFLSLHLTRHGFTVPAAGAMVTVYLVAGAVGGFLGGWLAERIGGQRVQKWSFLAATPLYAGFLLLPIPLGLASLTLGSFALQTSLPVNVVLGQELSPRHSSTISSLLMGAAWGVGALLIGPIGMLGDRLGLPAALFALIGMNAVGLACVLALPDLATFGADAGRDPAPVL
jgi:FSR family fosmidomycin resistance protein-like MFS transporter